MSTALIAGWAHTSFGRREEKDVEHLLAAVCGQALDHAGLPCEMVDGIFVGVFNGGFSKQGFEAAQVALALPELAYVPAVRVENACATGSAALYAALDFVNAGRGHVALVAGAEKMTATSGSAVADILLSASYRPEEGDFDAGFAGVFGQIASTYFQRYGDRSAELAMIAAKNHANGVRNPFAQMRKDLGFEFCNTVSERNPLVAAPLRRTDCSLVSDGAAALVVVSDQMIDHVRRAIRPRAIAQVNDHFPLSRRDPTAFEGARKAWSMALDRAGMTLQDLDMVETHDCFTMAELIQYEAMGLAPVGQGYRVVRDGVTAFDGALPVNPSGGLKAKGHPIGATGVSQHVLACMQLCGGAGEMQIADAELVGVFNMGGAAVTNYASILERAK